MTMIPIELSQFKQREVVLARGGARANGALFAGVISRFRGRLWFVTAGEDSGLAVDVTDGFKARVEQLPEDAFHDIDMSRVIDEPRPPNEVKIPLLAEELKDVGVCAKLGPVWVQRRFIDAVRLLPGYVGARWFAPRRVEHGAVQAVIGEKPVAFIAGVLRKRGAA